MIGPLPWLSTSHNLSHLPRNPLKGDPGTKMARGSSCSWLPGALKKTVLSLPRPRREGQESTRRLGRGWNGWEWESSGAFPTVLSLFMHSSTTPKALAPWQGDTVGVEERHRPTGSSPHLVPPKNCMMTVKSQYLCQESSPMIPSAWQRITYKRDWLPFRKQIPSSYGHEQTRTPKMGDHLSVTALSLQGT